LEVTRQQLKEVCVESQAVLKVLKENSIELELSKVSMTRNTEPPRFGSTTKTDSSSTSMEASIREQLQQQEAEYTQRCDLLVAQNNMLQKRNEELSVLLNNTKKDFDDAAEDRRDLLELIDILSTASNNGLSFVTILEAYLAKLGVSNAMHGGKTRAVGEKISNALELRRARAKGSLFSSTTGHQPNAIVNVLEQRNARTNVPKEIISPMSNHSQSTETSSNDDESEEFKSPYSASSNEKKALQRLNVVMQPNSSRQPSPSVFTKEAANSALVDAGPLQGSCSEDSSRLDLQYDLAKRAHQHAMSHSKLAAQLASQNLALHEGKADRLIKKSLSNSNLFAAKSQNVSAATSVNPITTSKDTNRSHSASSVNKRLMAGEKVSRFPEGQMQQQPLQESEVTDWRECLDPRTNRKYFYSPSLRKSTWTDPSKPSSSSRSRGSKSGTSPTFRSGSRGAGPATAKKNKSMVEMSRSQSSDYFASSSNNNGDTGTSQRPVGRTSSPALSATTLRSYSSPLKRTYGSNNRGLSRSSSRGEGIEEPQENVNSLWVMALDSKTNRYYWYNRQTKVSTWRKPV